MKNSNKILWSILLAFFTQIIYSQTLFYQTVGTFYTDATSNYLEQDRNNIKEVLSGGKLIGFCVASGGLGRDISNSIVLGTHLTYYDIDGSIIGDAFIANLLQKEIMFEVPLEVKNGYAFIAGRYISGVNQYLGVVRIDLSTMAISWQTTCSIDYGNYDIPVSMSVVGSALYVTGRTGGSSPEYEVYSTGRGFVAKFNNTNGNLQWAKTLTGQVTPQSIISYINGQNQHELLICGIVYQPDFSDVTIFVTKLDYTGAELFYNHYNIKGVWEEAFDALRTLDDKFLIIGSTVNLCQDGPSNALALKLDDNGDFLSAKVYGSTNTTQPSWIGFDGALSTSGDNSFYISGYEYTSDGIENSLILGVDDNLDLRWATTEGLSSESEKFFSIRAVCSDFPNYDCSGTSTPAIVACGVGNTPTYGLIDGQSFYTVIYDDGTTESDCDFQENGYTNTAIFEMLDGNDVESATTSNIQNTFTNKILVPVSDYICFDYYNSPKASQNQSNNSSVLFQIYPNPINQNSASISLNSYTELNLDTPYRIKDNYGATVDYGVIQIIGNIGNFEIKQSLTPGLYVFELFLGTQKHVSKIVIQ